MVQDEAERGRVERGIVDRQRLELPLPELGVADAGEPRARRPQHRTRAVDRDHLADERREGRGELARAAAEVGEGAAGPGVLPVHHPGHLSGLGIDQEVLRAEVAVHQAVPLGPVEQVLGRVRDLSQSLSGSA